MASIGCHSDVRGVRQLRDMGAGVLEGREIGSSEPEDSAWSRRGCFELLRALAPTIPATASTAILEFAEGVSLTHAMASACASDEIAPQD